MNKNKHKMKTMTINIPFLYELGEEGYHTGKVLNTAQDCMEEVQAEIESGVLNESVYMETSEELSVEEAKEILHNHGYFTESLWQIEDVLGDYDCTEEQARVILSQAMTHPVVYEAIWDAMDAEADNLNVEKK